MSRLARAKAAVKAALSNRRIRATPLAIHALAESLCYSDPSYLGDTDTLLAGLLMSGSYTVDVLEHAGVDRERLEDLTLVSIRGVAEWDDNSDVDVFEAGFSELTAGAELLARAQSTSNEIDVADILRVALTLDDEYIDGVFGDSASAFPRELRKDVAPSSPMLVALEERLCELLLLTVSYISAPQKPTQMLRRRTRLISGREDELLDKEFGSLFRGMRTEEFEFIIRVLNVWFVSRSLPIQPESLCLQTVHRCSQLLYGPQFVAESGGDLAKIEAGLAITRRLAPAHDEPFLALFNVAGQLVANHFSYRQSLLVPNMARDRKHEFLGTRLYAPRPLPIVSPEILYSFSRLIGNEVADVDIYRFLREHPDLIESLGYCRAVPQFSLRDTDSSAMSPDFILDVPGDRGHAFLRLASPARSPVIRDPVARATEEVSRAVAHLRRFGRHFESRQHRQEIEQEFGMTGFRPEVIVVIGRSSMFRSVADRMSFDSQLEAGVRVLTYDDVVGYAKTRGLPPELTSAIISMESFGLDSWTQSTDITRIEQNTAFGGHETGDTSTLWSRRCGSLDRGISKHKRLCRTLSTTSRLSVCSSSESAEHHPTRMPCSAM